MALITNLQPPAGVPVAADGVISFDVIDPVIEELKVFIWAVFTSTGQVELVRDGAFFQPNYSISTVASTPGGRTFSIRRVGGWPSQPQLRVDECACPPEISGSGGGLTAFANVGAGAWVGRNISGGNTLNLRSIQSSDGSATVTQNANDIDLAVRTEPVLVTSNMPVATPGPPPAQVLTLVEGAAGLYVDPPFPPTPPKDPLVVVFPPITASNFGRRVGVALAQGHTYTDIEWTPDLADAFIAPDYSVYGPGSPVGISAGAYPPTMLVWQAVEDLAGPGVHGWAFEYASNLSSGASGWASVLAIGNLSGANDAIMEGEQRLLSGGQAFSEAGGISWRTSRRYVNLDSGAGTWVQVGALVLGDTAITQSSLAVVKATAVADGIRGNDYAVLEEIWDVAAQTRVATITSLSTIFRFNSPNPYELAIEVEEHSGLGSTIAFATIDVTHLRYIPS